MKKYIVKNCPCIKQVDIEVYRELEEHFICKDTLELKDCENIETCLIKQVISKCKNIKNLLNGFDNDYNLGRITTAQGILELFEIDEGEQ
ncbi:hypothetical protein IKE67_08705 [bacterium]|nr:hypothetical protein [bacterium]